MSVGHYEYPERATLLNCPVLAFLSRTKWVEREVFKVLVISKKHTIFCSTMCSSEYDCDGGNTEDPISYDSRPPCSSCFKEEVISKKRRLHSVKCTKWNVSFVILIGLCVSFPTVLSSDERVSKAIRTFEFRRNHGGERKDVGVEFAGELFNFYLLPLS